MSPHLPESYWSDVNRYCGEILAGAKVRHASIFVMKVTVQEVMWEAETPNTTAALSQTITQYLGGLVRERPVHTLSLKDPILGTGKMIDYGISFYPHMEKIRSINNGLELELPPRTKGEPNLKTFSQDWKNLFTYSREYRHDQREKRAHGFYLPTQEDYDRLHSELRRGASGAYTIKDY